MILAMLSRPFQIHLSTALALMFAAGGLIWANLLDRGYSNLQPIPKIYSGHEAEDLSVQRFGWPNVVYINRPQIVYFQNGFGQAMGLNREPDFLYSGLVVNLGFGVFVLLGVWFLSEGWIFWSEKRGKL